MRLPGLVAVSALALSCAGATDKSLSPESAPPTMRDGAAKTPTERDVQRIASLSCDEALRVGLDDGLHPILLRALEATLLKCAPTLEPNAKLSGADRLRISQAAYRFFVALPNALNDARGPVQPSHSFSTNGEPRAQALGLLRAWVADPGWDAAAHADTKLDPSASPLAALSLSCEEVADLAPASRAGLVLARSLARDRGCGAELLESHARAGLGGTTQARGYVCVELGAARIRDGGWKDAVFQAAITDPGTRTCVSRRPWRTLGDLFAGTCDEWRSSYDGRPQCLAMFGERDHGVYIERSVVDGGAVTFNGYYLGSPRLAVAVTSDQTGVVQPGMVFSSSVSAALPIQAKGALGPGAEIRPLTLEVRNGSNYETPAGVVKEITMRMRGAPAISPIVPIIVDEDGSITVGSPR